MILLRRVIGDALRARRQSQHRTLREVSTAANVSLGYLSEIERGQKEASSELLAAICDALGAQLSELLHEVSTTVAAAERTDTPVTRVAPVALLPAQPRAQAQLMTAGTRLSAGVTPAETADEPARQLVPAAEGFTAGGTAIVLPKRTNVGPARTLSADGDVAVSVHQSGPLKATLRTTRNSRPGSRGRDVVCAL